MSVYEVTAKLDFRGHKPGERFEARLDPALERRAIRRGSIRLIHKSVTRLEEGSYKLPATIERKGT